MEPDGAKHVSAVVKGHDPESLFQRHWNAKLGVDQQQLVAAQRGRDLRAGAYVSRITASPNHLLRTSSIEGKTTQCISSTGKELLAQGNMSAKGIGETHANTVCPDNFLTGDGFVIRGLGEELSKVKVRSQNRRIEVGFKGLVDAFVGIELKVAGVANVSSRQCGEPDMAVRGRY